MPAAARLPFGGRVFYRLTFLILFRVVRSADCAVSSAGFYLMRYI